MPPIFAIHWAKNKFWSIDWKNISLTLDTLDTEEDLYLSNDDFTMCHYETFYVLEIKNCYINSYTLLSKFNFIQELYEIDEIVYNTDKVLIKYQRVEEIKETPDKKYISFVDNILNEGSRRTDRTKVGTIATFGSRIEFDISTNIPLLTTKRVAWKSCIEELLWMLRGETNSKILEEKGVNIWKGNTTREFLNSRGLYDYPEGEIGLLYGYSIRRWNGNFDQLKYIENLLKTDPFSRRIMWNLWNPSDFDKSVLPPCHCQCQFFVKEIGDLKFLSCHMYQRSVDSICGFPFNIFFYSVLTYILAYRCDMVPDKLIISTGDTHVYLNHLDAFEIQKEREPRISPVLGINKRIRDIEYEEMTIEDFILFGYYPHPKIQVEMAV